MLKFKKISLSVLFVLFIVFSVGLFGITMFILGVSVRDEDSKTSQGENVSSNSKEAIILSNLKETPPVGITGTITPTKPPLSLVIKSDKALDGYRSSDKTGNATKEIMIGRNTEAVTRGFVSFPLTRIPPRSTIRKATLRLYQTKIEGNPVSSMGGLYIDHLFYGNILDDTDYAMPALIAAAYEIQRSRNTGWKEAEVTNALLHDLALGRGVSQFRIHFEDEIRAKEGADYVYFESGEVVSGITNAPELFIEYTR